MEYLTDAQREVINARVTAGAARFDVDGPENWAQILNEYTNLLDVRSLDACPLAVLYGSYYRGLRELGLQRSDPWLGYDVIAAARLGFTLMSGDDELDTPRGDADNLGDDQAWTNAAFAAMTVAWHREATTRTAT